MQNNATPSHAALSHAAPPTTTSKFSTCGETQVILVDDFHSIIGYYQRNTLKIMWKFLEVKIGNYQIVMLKFITPFFETSLVVSR